jgi:DNA invertase Pin-like site-specific DNA recombinase
VSTQKQDFDRQILEIKQYFEARGINFDDCTDIVSEHISGGKSYNDRQLRMLLDKCENGDTIYAASTDRIGRSFSDMIRFMDEAKQRGVNVIACKQNLSLSDDSMTTKIILSIVTLMDEDERNRIRSRIVSSMEVRKRLIKEQGGFMSKTGNWITHLGVQDENRDYRPMQEAAHIAKTNYRLNWQENSAAFRWVKQKVVEGWTSKAILQELNNLYDIDPKNYCSRTGKRVSAGLLAQWRTRINQAEGLTQVDGRKEYAQRMREEKQRAIELEELRAQKDVQNEEEE